MSKNSPEGSGLLNVLINVILPVMILHNLSSRIGPVYALFLALSFPVGKGLWDFWKLRRANYFSILGILNVSMTGSLALLGLNGMWFAAKEAIFPSLIGAFVYASSFTQNPFIKTILVNPKVMNLDVIHEKLESEGKWQDFTAVLKRSTHFLAATFLVSAVCNFFLATRIFLPIDSSLEDVTRATILNKQIATMTMWASAIIIVPSILMLSGILWYLLRGIRRSTGLETEQILKS